MQYDLGRQGLGLLVIFSLGFGVLAQLVTRPATRWLWLLGAAGWFLGGLFASEVLFATATSGDIQPIIDGLALDKSLLGGLILGLIVVVTTRVMAGGRPLRPTTF